MSKLINEIQLAEWFAQSVFTVRRTRTANPERHPPFIRIGSSVRYDVSEVQKWLDSRTVNGLETPSLSSDSSDHSVRSESPKEKRPGPGRPKKAETVRKTKNANR